MAPARPLASPLYTNTGLLLLRAGAGLMMFSAHGWGKLTGFTTMVEHFPDPIGIGATASLAFAVFAEFFCSLAIVLGIATRLATIPLVCTMFTAAMFVHAADPWGKKELPLLYLVAFLTLMFTGPGAFSLDAMVRKVRG